MSIKNCPKCGKQFESTVCYVDKKGHNCKYEKNYCSRTCGNSRNWDEEHKKKLSETNKKLLAEGKLYLPNQKGKHLDKWEKRICKQCGKEFDDYKKSRSKYCSHSCSVKLNGGYRERSGRSKSGYYKETYCGSTYELAWVIYRIDHNLPVIRFPGEIKCETTGKRYIPDFIEGNVIYEIKGYERDDSVAVKTKIAEDHGFVVQVLRKKDLEKEFAWVKKKYNTNKFETLYDDYKPKFKYICPNCNKEFSRDRKSKNRLVFCSRYCCGVYIANSKKKEKKTFDYVCAYCNKKFSRDKKNKNALAFCSQHCCAIYISKNRKRN